MCLSRKVAFVKGIYCTYRSYHRARTESWILKKVLKFVQLFSRPGKSREEMKSGKNDKKSWEFFSNLQQVLFKWFFFRFFFFSNLIQPLPYVCSVPRRKLCSCVLKSLLNTCLITLSLEKDIIVSKKVLEKVLHFESKNLCEPCYQLFAWHLFSVVFFFSQPFSPSCLRRWWV